MTTDQLTTEFETFQGELKSVLLRMTASVQDAEDIVQDTYIKARAKLDTFRGESSLKTWIFSIASNLAKDLRREWPDLDLSALVRVWRLCKVPSRQMSSTYLGYCA